MVARNAIDDMVALTVESPFGASLELGCELCVGAFPMNVALIVMKMFSHLIYYKYIL
jgi:hypothetical protein